MNPRDTIFARALKGDILKFNQEGEAKKRIISAAMKQTRRDLKMNDLLV